MDIMIDYSQKELAKVEINSFINEGLQDMYNNELIDFDDAFDELEERYGADE